MERFTDKVVVVTGAASGIGAATARRFANEGARVVLADINESGLAAQVSAIEAAGGRAVGIRCDVGETQAWTHLAAEIEDGFGRVDVVHNNAFVMKLAPAHELSEEWWDRQLAVGLSSIYHSVRSLYRLMSAPSCSMVNTSSVHAPSWKAHPAYDACKGGIVSLSRQLAVEYGPRLRVNAVLPGAILTGAWEGASQEDFDRYAAATVAKRIGKPEEIAAAVAFLALDEASYITGTTLIVDGGLLAIGDRWNQIDELTQPMAVGDDTELRRVLERLRASYREGVTKPVVWRRAQLAAIEQLLSDNEERIAAALVVDLGRSRFKGRLSDVSAVRGEVRALSRALRRFARQRRVRLPLVLRPARAAIRNDPFGVVLVVSPWNYPVNLALVPLAAALASGNCAVIAPSELAPATADLLSELVPRYLDDGAVAIVRGGATPVQELISGGVDHVFFTGSARVGRLVALAAAELMTPVTLELGGKCPAIVAADADLRVAARRIVWGRFFNAGQSCIAPDYVLVDRRIADEFVSEVVATIAVFFGADPAASPDFGRVVNAGHVDRLVRLLEGHGGELVTGGDFDRAARYVAPTVLRDVAPDSAVMTEEIFGPILPVIACGDVTEAVDFVARRPDPLTIYVYTKDRRLARCVIDETASGSVAVNTSLEHFVVPALPFGGVGASGHGEYHGRFGLSTFSHRRAVLWRPARRQLSLSVPPYTDRKSRLLRRLL